MTILLSQIEARKLLGIGEKMFPTLGIPYIKIGKRYKYREEAIEEWIIQNEKSGSAVKCQSAKGGARRSTGTTLRSKGLDFEEVLRQTTNNSLSL